MTSRFEDIIIWQKAYKFVLEVYKIANGFPECERFGLCSQFKRAAVSIPANIAEGYKKLSKPDKLRFYNIAQGSLEECRCYVHLSRDLGYIGDEPHDYLYALLVETSRLLNAYCRGVLNNGYRENGHKSIDFNYSNYL